ncbi:MAG TPA: ABC transporter permease [Vicinamibacterales bacterium]|nr:ABC transporter permease [Vicinamibacterales bacterium]
MNVLLGIWRDLVLATRSLAKTRAFTFVCVLSLGIGMAPVIAIQYGSRIFTTPPPAVNVDHPTALVELVTTQIGSHRPTSNWSWPDFSDLRDAETGVSLTGWASGNSAVIIPASGMKRRADTMFVSPNYFSTIGVALVRGPGFSKTETTEPVVILTHTFWRQHLSSDPDIVGKTLTVDGTPHVVAGITPETFAGHVSFLDPEFFLPLEQHPLLVGDKGARFDRSKAFVRIHGRLLPGATVTQASAAVSAITARLAREYPATNEFRAGIVEPYFAAGSLENAEVAVLLSVGQAVMLIPLLVVCLNVSGMVQVRSAMRERELTIRQALGASRKRLMRHLLAESIVLAGLGCTLASVVLFNLPPLLSWWMGEPLPAKLQAALNVDLRMIAVCAGLCLATSLLCGWLPALRFSRPKIMTVLKDETGTGGIRAGRVHRVTCALQVAMAVPLLILSFVSLDRVRATASADLGFAADLLYAAPLELKATGKLEAQVRRVRDTVAEANGVASVTVADGLPLDFRYRIARVSPQVNTALSPQSREQGERPAEAEPAIVSAHVTRVGDGYLDTMRIPLVRGRGFTTEDAAGAAMVTIVSKPLADELFPDGDVIGRKLLFDVGNEDKKQPQTLTIVGVTADFPTSQMSTDREQLLLPLAQHADVLNDSVRVDDDRGGEAMLMVVARSAAGEPAPKMTAILENAVRDFDPDFDRAEITTGVWLRQKSMDDFFGQFGVGAVAGGVCLLLAALGIYGVVGLMVTTRTRELAVRVTLGASRSRVIGMILFDVIKLVGPGVAIGMIITVGLVRLDGGIRISTVEPLAYVAGAAIAILIAVLASVAPARRAASVQPMVAMRST